jgi:DNA-binding GntR family transcriptional regulator
VAYRALADSIRREIRSGQYVGGRKLPTEEQLAARHSVSRQTVRRAMQDLVSEGIIYRVAGRGTYPVAEEDRYVRQFGSVEELMALSVDTECEIVSPLQRRIDVANAGRLQLASDELYALALIRLHGGVPFCFTSVFLPPRIAALVSDVPDLTVSGRRSRVTVIGLIDARMSRAIAAAEQSITATGAPSFAAERLPCQPGQPVLRIDRQYRDEAGRPVELAVSYFDPEHYSYRVRLRRSPG